MRTIAAWTALSLSLQVAPCRGLQLRAYQAAVHDRFTGFPAAPAMNPDFLHGASRFTGVGWYAADPRRQFTLVTPRHFVCATHFVPAIGGAVRFVDSDGAMVERSVTAVAAVPNDSGGNSDLALGTLDSDVPATVTPFRWLNLAGNDAYRGARLMVFGKEARGGRGLFDGVETLDEPGIDDTVMARFLYRSAAGESDDCHFEGGDSGSPCFASVNGEPALVSVNGAVNRVPGTVKNLGAFIPHYATRLDALLAADGATLAPVFPSAAGLVLESETQPGTLRRLRPGAAIFTLGNPGAATAENLVAKAIFDSPNAPDHLSAPGWTVSGGSGGVWTLERASLPAGGTTAITASWTELPDTERIEAFIDLVSDASPDARYEIALELAPSYASWSQGLTEAGHDEDPDGDGLPNLLEYALGGDPRGGGTELPDGVPLRPSLSSGDGSFTLVFPERADAELRGISYLIETSDALAEGSWTAEPLPGAQSVTDPWSPEAPGFVKRTISWPPAGPRRFVRLRVTLDE